MKLWDHQKRRLDFARGKPAVLDWVEMGAGKTRAQLEELRSMPATGQALVLCPKAICPVWAGQAERFAPELTPVVLEGTTRQKAIQADKYLLSPRRLFITNYESAIRPPLSTWLLSRPWEYVVLDESHRIKAPGGVTSRFAQTLGKRARRRRCLTGTFLPNNRLDAYAQMRFLDPGVFGTSFNRFRARYCVTVERVTRAGKRYPDIIDWINTDEFDEKLSRVTFRAGPEVLDLPPVTHQEIQVTLGKEARRRYDQMEATFVADVRSGAIRARNSLSRLLRLQQITGGCLPLPVGDPDEGGVTPDEYHRFGRDKMEAMQTLLDGLPPTEPVVVFCRFRADLDAVAETADEFKRAYSELSGRRDQLQEWQNSHSSILGAQIQAGSLGVDMTRARYVIFYSLGFDLAAYLQALKRSHRPGQERKVHYYHLIARDTIDQQVYRALSQKKNAVDSVIRAILKRKEVS